MGKFGKPKNFRGFVYIFIFITASVLLLVGIGIYLSPVCTLRGIWIFLYNYYKIYFYAITVLAVSMSCFQCIQDFENTVSEVAYKTLVCLFSFYLSYCICNSSTLDRMLHILSRSQNDLVRLFIGLFLSAFLTVAVTAELLAVPTYYRVIKNHISKFKYEIIFFLFLSGKLLLNNTRSINRWVTSWYAMDYRHTGFGSRLLPGTILGLLLHSDNINPRKAYFFVWCATLLLYAVLAHLFGKCIRECQKNYKEAVTYLILIYLASPMSIEYLISGSCMGRLELFVLIFVLFFVIGYNKIQSNFTKCIFGCLMSAGYLACHQGGLFLFFPILFTVLVLDMEERKFEKKSVISAGIICIANGILFLVFQFCTKIKFHTLEELLADIQSRTTLPTSDTALYYEYFADVKEAYREFCIPFLTGEDSYYPRENTFLLLLILFPLLILLIGLWVKAYRNGKKQLYFWLLLSDLSVLPQFILNVDWGRWISSIVGVQVFQLLYLTYKRDSGMETAMSGLLRFLKKNGILCAFILIYLAAFHKLADKGYNGITNSIFWILKTHTLSY